MAGGLNPGITKTYTGHVDLMNSTLEAFDKGFFSETLGRTSYEGAQMFFEEAREDNSGGTRLEWEVRLRKSGTAQWIAPYAVTGNTQQNLTAKANAPWRAFQEKVHYDILEKNMNMGKEQLVDVMLPKYSGAIEAIIELIDNAVFGAMSSITDEDPIYGLQYWFSPPGTVSNGSYATATDYTGGFNGQTWRAADGTASNTIGGIDASDVANSRWRTWTASHGGLMNATLVETIKRGLTRTKFKSLKGADGKSKREGHGRRVLFMSHNMADGYETIINSGPDWLNGDAAGKTEAKLRKVDIIRADALGDYSYDPIFAVDTGKIYGRVLTQRESDENGMPVRSWMAKIPYTRDRSAMTTLTAAAVAQLQIQCDDRRGAGFGVYGVIA